MSAEELVKQPEDVKAQAGGGIFDSGITLADDIGKDSDWGALAIDGVMVGLDALSLVMNPLGELVKAGVGWLMEHLDFIREPLEVLTGDPAQVDAIAGTWENISKRLTEARDQYQAAMSLTDGWTGDAAAQYRTLAQSYIDGLAGVSAQASDAASGVKMAGVVVGTERAIIFDLIASFISDVITKALLALASSWFTFGASLGVFVASVVADAVALAAKLQKRIGKLLQVIQQFVSKYRVLGDRSAQAAKTLGRKSSELGREANKAIKASTKTAERLAPQSGNLKKYTDYVEKMEDSAIAKRLDGMPGKVAKEGTKATKDAVFPDGGDDNKGK